MSQHGEEFLTLLRFFKALADESRLKIVGILAGRECSVEELAALLGLKEPAVSHHLGKLEELGLVRVRPVGTSRLYRLDAEPLRAMNRELFTQEKVEILAGEAVANEGAGGSDADPWERKVLDNFREGERLKEIPAGLKKRLVILRWLAAGFDPARRYPEREVNDILKRHHPDCATLRRELVDHGLLARERGVYWRLAEAPRAITTTSP